VNSLAFFGGILKQRAVRHTSMIEAEVQARHPLIYAAIKAKDCPDLDWSSVAEDLERLQWLEDGNNLSELVGEYGASWRSTLIQS
jgi:hypothetical protein